MGLYLGWQNFGHRVADEPSVAYYNATIHSSSTGEATSSSSAVNRHAELIPTQTDAVP
jgi:hypothetical protein